MSKNVCVLLILFLSMATVAHARISHGVIKEGLTLESKILGKKVRYTIYLPYDYETSARLYPAVYLLHGYHDNDMSWIQFGEANTIADQAIASREIPPMVIIMPDAGASWYVNNFDNSVRYEDFFFQELIPFMESHYRLRPEKRYRALAGQSMGGFGALNFAMHRPDMFDVCAVMGPAVNTPDEFVAMSDTTWNGGWPVTLYGRKTGQERLTEHLLSYNPIRIAETGDVEKLRTVRFYIDCGDDDYLTVANSTLHISMTKRKIPHEFRVRDGAHAWTYWRSGL
ncbi:MAG: alpha/beta hydrolase-fold protein, partial [bacterium]